jgi:hypothetical protein
LSFQTEREAKTFPPNVWATLDRVRENVADLVLVHGGDSKGADRLVASWAEQRKVPQVAFSLDRRLGQRAGFRRNQQMLSLNPRYVIAFPGSGVVERLVINAKQKASRSSIGVDRSAPIQSARRGLPLLRHSGAGEPPASFRVDYCGTA